MLVCVLHSKLYSNSPSPFLYFVKSGWNVYPA